MSEENVMKIKKILRPGGTIRKYIDDYKFKSIFIRNTLLLILLIMLPLSGLSFLAYYAYGNLQKNEMRAISEKTTFDYYKDWQRILKEAKTELGYLGYNTNSELFMYDTAELRQLNYKIRNIQELILLPILTREYVDSIYLYSNKSGKVITVEGVSDYDMFHAKVYMDRYIADQTPEIQVTENTAGTHPKRQISVFQEVSYGTKPNGLVVMNLDVSDLRKMFGAPESVRMYLTDGSIILYAGEAALVGESVQSIAGYEHVRHGEVNLWRNLGICSMMTEKGNLEIITFTDMTGYRDQLSTVRTSMFLFLAFVTFLTVLLSVLVSVRIFRPIGEIVASLRKYQNVLVGDEEPFQEKNELEYILQSIQKTVHVKRDIDQELADRVRLLKKAQAVALQSQINPHFMNNTLETVNWTAISLLGGRNEISEITGALSKMLRMALEDTDTIIPIGREIEHCMYYLKIQETRYEDKFEAVWNIPPEIARCKTIRIILQPIVENAIYHGIKPLSNKGKITISGEFCGNDVVLEVADNGLGMTKEELEELRGNMRSDMIKESRHIGVANVNQRLKLYFGEEYGVFIESGEGMGTTVRICFPKILS